MGKTYRNVLTKPRGEYYQRGVARAKDRNAHHRHRNLNHGCHDEIYFVPFGMEFKREDCVYFHNRQKSNIPNDSSRTLEAFFRSNQWVHCSLQENLLHHIKLGKKNRAVENKDVSYLENTLKQVKRRGAAKRFIGHDKGCDKVDCYMFEHFPPVLPSNTFQHKML
jgi:hypothetical protein